MDNPEKLATRRTKQKHNTLFVGHRYVQANTNSINKTWVLLLEPKTNRTPFLFGNRNENHNGEIRT